jgi:hypothetical protein
MVVLIVVQRGGVEHDIWERQCYGWSSCHDKTILLILLEMEGRYVVDSDGSSAELRDKNLCIHPIVPQNEPYNCEPVKAHS